MARGFTSLQVVLLLAGVPLLGQIIIPGVGYPRGGGYPGGYPPGGYPPGGYPPGQQYPQGGQGPSQGRESNSNATTLTGILRKIGDKSIVIETDNQTVTTVNIAGSTKYIGTSGSSAKIGDFQPGDHVRIATGKDNKNGYKAANMTLMQEGTPEEHSLASAHTEDTQPLPGKTPANSSASNATSSGGDGSRPSLRRAASSSSDDSNAGSSSGTSSADSGRPSLRRTPSSGSSDSSSSSSSSNSSSGDYDPNRPVLHRAPGSSDTSNSSSASNNSAPASTADDNDPDRPHLHRTSPASNNTADSSSANNSSGSSSSASSGNYDDDRPRIRRAVSDADATPGAQINPGDSATVAPPPPQSRRPAPSPDSDPVVVASARPSLHADDSNGATRLPEPPHLGAPADTISSDNSRLPRAMPTSEDPFIDQARDAAMSFSETLPNYVVKQFTTRYATVPTRNGRTSWQALDNVTADVIEEDGNEKYKNILVNGRPPRDDIEKTGSWSRGEFSSLLQDIMSPYTNAEFRGKRATTIVNRAAFRYDFSVEQPNSHWHVQSEGQSYMPAYSGAIWIDKETYRVLRIELAAQNMPRGFPLDQVESAVDYDFVFIGDTKYLLPTHSEALSCERQGTNCTRNVIEFRNYKKFSADTSITFDDK